MNDLIEVTKSYLANYPRMTNMERETIIRVIYTHVRMLAKEEKLIIPGIVGIEEDYNAKKK